jgi:hypothetical protein
MVPTFGGLAYIDPVTKEIFCGFGPKERFSWLENGFIEFKLQKIE